MQQCLQTTPHILWPVSGADRDRCCRQYSVRQTFFVPFQKIVQPGFPEGPTSRLKDCLPQFSACNAAMDYWYSGLANRSPAKAEQNKRLAVTIQSSDFLWKLLELNVQHYSSHKNLSRQQCYATLQFAIACSLEHNSALAV